MGPELSFREVSDQKGVRQSYCSSPEQKGPANRTDGVQKECFQKETEKVHMAAVYLEIVIPINRRY